MNLLGPLANPAGVRRQVLGVSDRTRAPLVAQALSRLGAVHALVVHAEVGMDEISPSGCTLVWEIRGASVSEWTLDPATHGLAVADLAALSGGEPAENAHRIEALLAGAPDLAGRAAVLINAAAAIYVSEEGPAFGDAVVRAREALDGGAGREALERLKRAGQAPRRTASD
jgi:anthranilate phosphoribosyltransferase